MNKVASGVRLQRQIVVQRRTGSDTRTAAARWPLLRPAPHAAHPSDGRVRRSADRLLRATGSPLERSAGSLPSPFQGDPLPVRRRACGHRLIVAKSSVPLEDHAAHRVCELNVGTGFPIGHIEGDEAARVLAGRQRA